MWIRLLRRSLWMMCLLVACGAFGCAGSSKYMRELLAPERLSAPADTATVVFLRPSGVAFAINFAILDQKGNWMGDAVSQSQFAVALPPGEYMFVAWAENSAALKATLAAGRIYYVEVIPKMGLGSARVALEALSPRHEDWSSLRKWINETKRLEPLPTGTDYIASRREDALQKIASAKEDWQGYSAEEKDKRTLRAEDGEAGEHPPAGAVAASTGPACSKDTECPGDQVCSNAHCSLPGGAAAAAAPCTTDKDCPGDQICEQKVCRNPGGAPAAAPAAAQAPPARCAKDADCSGGLLCIGMLCKPVPGVTPQPAAPPPAAPAASQCTKNADCSEDQFCSKGQCAPVPGTAPACKKTSDCPADTICKKGRCAPPDAK